eukprot:gene17675-24025_t
MASPPPISGGSETSIGDAARFGVLTISDRQLIPSGKLCTK